MPKLIFNGNKRDMKRLSKAQNSVDVFLKKHPKDLTKRQHKALRKKLSKRADALSKATGMKIHSLFD